MIYSYKNLTKEELTYLVVMSSMKKCCVDDVMREILKEAVEKELENRSSILI